MISKNDILLISIIPVAGIIAYNSEHRQKINTLLSQPSLYIQFVAAIIITFITVWFYKVEDSNGKSETYKRTKIRNSLLAAWITFTVTVCSEFHLLLAPFWIVFITTLLYQN